MKRGVGYILAAALTIAPSGALADGASEASKDDARTVMRDFAECLVGSFSERRAREIDAFLAVSPFAPGAGALGRKLATSECLTSRYPGKSIASLSMPPQLLRGDLFRARFQRFLAKRPIAPFAPYDVNARWHVPVDDKFAPYQAIGECAVRGDPASSRAVLGAKVGSSAEDAAFTALVPVLQKCMPATGTFRFSRAMLEALLAEAIYHLSADALAPAPAVESK